MDLFAQGVLSEEGRKERIVTTDMVHYLIQRTMDKFLEENLEPLLWMFTEEEEKEVFNYFESRYPQGLDLKEYFEEILKEKKYYEEEEEGVTDTK